MHIYGAFASWRRTLAASAGPRDVLRTSALCVYVRVPWSLRSPSRPWRLTMKSTTIVANSYYYLEQSRNVILSLIIHRKPPSILLYLCSTCALYLRSARSVEWDNKLHGCIICLTIIVIAKRPPKIYDSPVANDVTCTSEGKVRIRHKMETCLGVWKSISEFEGL